MLRDLSNDFYGRCPCVLHLSPVLNLNQEAVAGSRSALACSILINIVNSAISSLSRPLDIIVLITFIFQNVVELCTLHVPPKII
jgi:hypothetical protein